MPFPGISSKTILSTTFRMACLIGCIFQSKEVCEVYFKYSTTTSTRMIVPTTLPTPALSVCFTYNPVLDRTHYKRYGLQEKPILWRGHFGGSDKLTVKQIFQLTRRANDTLYYCDRRSDDSFFFRSMEGRDCMSEMNVTKYYMQEYVCYAYSFNKMTTVHPGKIAHAITYSNFAYSLIMKDRPPGARVYAFAHPSGSLPLVSRNYGKEFDRKIHSNGVGGHPNKIFVIYRPINIYLLSPPYDTGCTYDYNSHKDMCRRMCLIEKMKEIGRVPFSEIITDPVDLKHVNFNDMYNKTRLKLIQSYYDGCEGKCHRPLCDTRFSTSDVHLRTETHGGLVAFIVRMLVPDKPSIEITHTACVTFLDFLIYLCSSIGMWFGFSVTSLMNIRVSKVLPKQAASDHRVSLLFSLIDKLQHEVGMLQRERRQLLITTSVEK